MPVPDFLDTNVLLYAYDPNNRKKRGIAMDLLRKALAARESHSSPITTL
jgi:predicted nucleic acid-binding protein